MRLKKHNKKIVNEPHVDRKIYWNFCLMNLPCKMPCVYAK